MQIFNTRSSELSDSLRAQGHVVIAQALFDIVPYLSKQDKAYLTLCFPNIDKLIFLSPNAVRYAASLIMPIWSQRKVSLQVCAIGSKTASLLQAKLACEIFVPKKYFSSEGLLELPIFNQVEGEHIFVITAPEGRCLLQEKLREKAAILHEIFVYRREMAQKTQTLPLEKKCLVICTSELGLCHFFKLYPEARHFYENALEWLLSSERLKQIAMNCYQIPPQRIHVAVNASDTALLAITEGLR